MLRTGLIAIAGGAVLARFSGGLARWPMATLLAISAQPLEEGLIGQPGPFPEFCTLRPVAVLG